MNLFIRLFFAICSSNLERLECPHLSFSSVVVLPQFVAAGKYRGVGFLEFVCRVFRRGPLSTLVACFCQMNPRSKQVLVLVTLASWLCPCNPVFCWRSWGFELGLTSANGVTVSSPSNLKSSADAEGVNFQSGTVCFWVRNQGNRLGKGCLVDCASVSWMLLFWASSASVVVLQWKEVLDSSQQRNSLRLLSSGHFLGIKKHVHIMKTSAFLYEDQGQRRERMKQ